MRFHRGSAFAVALAALAAAGCADYQFNEVNRCTIQPGSKEVALPNISSADILFVVDDSGSMLGKQTKLAEAFDQFVNSLNSFNDNERVNLEPFDFHIAITTSSVFYDQPTAAMCQATCGTYPNVCGTLSGAGTPVCTPMRIARKCGAGLGCGTNFSCKTTCNGYAGQSVCCDAGGTNVETTTVSCTDAEVATSTACGQVKERYAFDRPPVTCSTTSNCAAGNICTTTSKQCAGVTYASAVCCQTQTCGSSAECPSGYSCGVCDGVANICCKTGSPSGPAGPTQTQLACVPGVGVDGALYPQGDFVGGVTTTGRAAVQGANPRVLHFDKSLYATQSGDAWVQVASTLTATNRQGFTRAELKNFFADTTKTTPTGNVMVGTCGSGQEQHLQAGRLAISKALAGQQFDVVGLTSTARVPGVPAAWPHAGAKLVVVYVADEDDCSSPADPVRGVILTGAPPKDSCWHDAFNDNGTPKPVDQQKEFRVTDFVSSLTALDRPLGAAYIVSATMSGDPSDSTCVDTQCVPNVCQPDLTCTAKFPANQCGGVAAGYRLTEAGAELRAAGADVIDASICNSAFGPILGRVAQIVKPPTNLTVPTQPASASMTLLRITNPDGTTRKICRGPALPPLTFQQAHDQAYDWWFVSDPNGVDEAPTGPTRYINLNHDTHQCEANPGEGYSADYLGMVPPAGCVPSIGDPTGDQACTKALGNAVPWTCYAGTDAAGVCLAPTISASSGPGPGTCLCNPPSIVCPNGRL